RERRKSLAGQESMMIRSQALRTWSRKYADRLDRVTSRTTPQRSVGGAAVRRQRPGGGVLGVTRRPAPLRRNRFLACHRWRHAADDRSGWTSGPVVRRAVLRPGRRRRCQRRARRRRPRERRRSDIWSDLWFCLAPEGLRLSIPRGPGRLG